MRRILLLLSISLLSYNAWTQNDDATSSNGYVQKDAMKAHAGRNFVKLNLTNLAIKNIYLSYERAIFKPLSVNLGFGVMPSMTIPYIKSFVKEPNVTSNDYEVIRALHQTQLSGKIFNLSARLYLGRGWGKGFYFEPYYRYVNYKISNFDIELDEYLSAGSSHPTQPILAMEGDLKAHAGGVLMGTQWLLGKKKRVLLDVWWLGLHYGKSVGTIDGVANISLTDEEVNTLQEAFDDVKIENKFVNVDTKVNSDGTTIKIDGPWAGFRFGLSIGYRF